MILVVIVVHMSDPWLYLLCTNYDIMLIFVYTLLLKIELEIMSIIIPAKLLQCHDFY